jgi:hypothetical protein
VIRVFPLDTSLNVNRGVPRGGWGSDKYGVYRVVTCCRPAARPILNRLNRHVIRTDETLESIRAASGGLRTQAYILHVFGP